MFEWLLVSLSLIAILLNMYEHKSCFYIWVIVDLCFAYIQESDAQRYLWLMYGAVSALGLYTWRNKKW